MEIHKEFLKVISLMSYRQIYLVWGFHNKMEVGEKLEVETYKNVVFIYFACLIIKWIITK